MQNPKNYFWSSHNSYLGNHQIAWLTTDYGLSKFGKTVEEARAVYPFYASKIEAIEELMELRSKFKDGQVLGENDFLDEIREINSLIYGPGKRSIFSCKMNLFLIEHWLLIKRIVHYKSSEMKYLLLGLISLLSFDIQSLEYEIQLENESVRVARAKIMPNEEIGLHRDAYP